MMKVRVGVSFMEADFWVGVGAGKGLLDVVVDEAG